MKSYVREETVKYNDKQNINSYKRFIGLPVDCENVI